MSYSSQSFQHEISLPESKYTQVISTNPSTIHKPNIAEKLRNYFDTIYNDPRAPDIRRFTWDPWYIRCSDGKKGELAPLPGDTDLYYGEEEDHSILEGEREAVGEQIQYSLKRVQASTFFDSEESLYEAFIDEITEIGKSIGLVSTTPPWLSLYTHNDLQNFHTDASHGPMAWVYALPPSENTYEGGDTMLMHPTILNFWYSYSFENFKEEDHGSGKELPSIIRFIPSKTLGKCIAFDPRVPHGVSQVKMKHPNDIREGRLVLHGWFAEPQIVWNGFQKEELELLEMMEDDDENKQDENMELLQNTLDPLIQTLGEGDIGRVMGYLAVKMEVLRDGSIGTINAVCDTLVADPNDFRGIIGYDEEDRPVMEDAVSDVKLTIYESLKNIYFTEIENDSKRHVIVPFSFE